MKRLLVLGSSGFIGRNITPILRERYHITAPTRAELDLLDMDAVTHYLEQGRFDVIINAATPTGHNPLDSQIFERSLRAFTALAHNAGLFGKMLYIGSGAEYGKQRAIVHVKEDEFGQRLPRDDYGLSRFIMSELAERTDNIINLRVFGCYGAGDPSHKLIPHIMNCIRQEKTIQLAQNVRFSFLYVRDIAHILMLLIEGVPKFKAYNLTSGVPLLIGDIAARVERMMGSDKPIVFRQSGMGLEYTGDNSRLCAEFPEWHPTTMDAGIHEVISIENSRL